MRKQQVALSATTLHAELTKVPKWVLGTFFLEFAAAFFAANWYVGLGPAPVDLYAVLAASLLTLIGVLPGFVSLLVVGRPVVILDRGLVLFRGWMSFVLATFTIVWLSALTMTLSSMSTTDPSYATRFASVSLSLLTTLMTPLIFACFAQRLSAPTSTRVMVARVLRSEKHHAASASLMKNLRDVAIREFESGDRPACEQRLWGLATIGGLAQNPTVQRQAVDELAFIAENYILDRDLALEAVVLLRSLHETAKNQHIDAMIARQLIDLVGASLARDEASGRVTEEASKLLCEIVSTTRIDVDAPGALLPYARINPRAATPALGLILQLCDTSRTTLNRSDIDALLDMIDDRRARIQCRLRYLETIFSSEPGKRAINNTVRPEVFRLSDDLFSSMDEVHPTAREIRDRIARAFDRDQQWLYELISKLIVSAPWRNEAATATDPRGAVMAEMLVEAVEHRDAATQQRISTFVLDQTGPTFRAFAPALAQGLDRYLESLIRHEANAVAATTGARQAPGLGPHSSCSGQIGAFLDVSCRLLENGLQFEDTKVARRALRALERAEGAGLLGSPDTFAFRLDRLTHSVRSSEMTAETDVMCEARGFIAARAIESRELGAIGALYESLDVEALALPEVRILAHALAVLGSAQARPDQPEVEGAYEIAYSLVSSWVRQAQRADVYRLCFASADCFPPSSLEPLLSLLVSSADAGLSRASVPALWLGTRVHELAPADRTNGRRPLTDSAWSWVTGEAPRLLRASLEDLTDQDLTHLRFSVRVWMEAVVAGLADREWTADLTALACMIKAGVMSPGDVSRAIRRDAVRSLDTGTASGLAVQLVRHGQAPAAMRLLSRCHEPKTAREILDCARRQLEEADEAARIDTARALIDELWHWSSQGRRPERFVGPVPIESMLKSCRSSLFHGPQSRLSMGDPGIARLTEMERRFRRRPADATRRL